MKAITFHTPGGPEVLCYEEVEDPVPGPGEALIRVRACALNHLDLILRGRGPAAGLPLPHIAGADAAGLVAGLGPGVTGVELGAAVVLNPALSCGACRYCRAGEQSLCEHFGILGRDARGAMAEYVVVPAANLYPLPANLPVVQAAAAPLVNMTAWRMVITKAQLRPGERVLVVGAGGGVATAAIQIAKLTGAIVYATTGGPEKMGRARAIGADQVIDYRAADVVSVVMDLTGGEGVDVVVDSVGAATWEASLRCLSKGGRLVTCGATTAPIAPMDIRFMWRKQISLHGSTMANHHEFTTVMGLLAAGKLHPVVDRTFPLSQARDAEIYLESAHQFGKVVLEV
jgi:NADPH:quinone reductase-like Zn-dependent oxidoreductase